MAADDIFRREAVDEYLAGERALGLVRLAPPWTWASVLLVGAAVAAALLASVVCQVEVTSRGRGMLRPKSGIRVLTTQTGGVVSEVLARPGQAVAAGAPILRLASAPLQAQLLEAERQLQLLESDFVKRTNGVAATLAEQQRLLRGRVGVLEQQVASLEESTRLYQRKVRANEELAEGGLVSQLGLEDAREALAQARRQVSAARLQLDLARQEVAELQARGSDLGWERERELRTASDRRDVLAFALAQTEVRAPLAGVVDAVLVAPGDVVQAAQVAGKLIPGEAELHLVAFVPEGDRAFIKVGDPVKLELDQLPFGEFGTVPGRVSRVADDPASPAEVAEVLGAQERLEGARYRIEVEPLPGSEGRRAAPLRSGMLAGVRYTLRRQRPITLLLDPLRRWLD